MGRYLLQNSKQYLLSQEDIEPIISVIFKKISKSSNFKAISINFIAIFDSYIMSSFNFWLTGD